MVRFDVYKVIARAALTISHFRALSLHLFVASAILITEWRSSENSEARRYKEAIESSINILEQVQSQNEIARHAIPILRRQFYISQRRQGDVASKLLPK
jgi:hypothetical protein